MNSKMKQNMILIAFGVFLYAALMNYSDIIAFSKGLFGIFLPIISGLIIAFVLNVPMSGFENLYRRLFQKATRKSSDGMISTLILLSTIGCIILIIILICTMIIPEIVSSVRSIYTIIAVKSPEWIAKLGQFGVDTTWIDQQLSGIDFENLFKALHIAHQATKVDFKMMMIGDGDRKNEIRLREKRYYSPCVRQSGI